MQTLEILERPRGKSSVSLAERAVALDAYRYWLTTALWIVPVLMTLSAGTAVLLTSRQTPVYRSSATLAVVPNTAIQEVPELLRGIETLERRTVIATIARLPSMTVVRETAAQTLDGSAVPPDYSARGAVVPNTNLVRVEVEGSDPDRAAAFANALGGAVAAQAQAMYRVIELRTLAAAVPPAGPAAPNPKRALVLALVLGGVLGVAATYLFVRFNDRRAAVA